MATARGLHPLAEDGRSCPSAGNRMEYRYFVTSRKNGKFVSALKIHKRGRVALTEWYVNWTCAGYMQRFTLSLRRQIQRREGCIVRGAAPFAGEPKNANGEFLHLNG